MNPCTMTPLNPPASRQPRPRPSRTPLLGAALFASFGTAALAQDACNEKVFFFSEYGDNTQVYDASTGSVDRFDSYDSPACFTTYLAGFSKPIEDTDNPASPANAIYPFVLDGYSAFDPDNVSYAVLRVDVFYQHRDTFSNDTFGTYGDTACTTTGGYQFAPALQARLTDVDQDHSQWVAIHVDLTSERVFAAGVDAFGVPIPGLDYGQIGTLAPGIGARILISASDGDLYGLAQDDLRIGYVSLVGMAGRPSTDLVRCPTSVSLVTGQYNSGNPASLCADDGDYLIYQSASGGLSGSSPLAKIVEYEAYFTGVNPALDYCTFCLTLMGNTGLRPDTVEIWLMNYTTGSFDMVDSAYFPNSREGGDGYRRTCISSPAPRYISPTGDVVVKLKMARWRWPGVYHLATERLILETRTVP